MNETADTRSEQEADAETLIAKRERLRIYASIRQWWRRNFVRTVDQTEAYRRVREEGGLDGRYIFMTSMSAGIAVLGLIQSSPAVVIGAMLLSPLMGPIIGSGLALAIGDIRWLRQTGKTLLYGVIAGVLISAFITYLSPIQTVTPEIAGRTRPTLIDLAVALFSGLAGAYAMIKGRQGTIVGVAIATALMPPLSVVGFGLATFNWTAFGGALMLFITNLMTIALTTAVMARLYGFRTNLSKKQTQMQVAGIVLAFVVLAVPLSFSLRQIVWEANVTRQVNQALAREFDKRARVNQVDIDFDAEPVRVTATVLTPDFRDQADVRASAALSDTIGQPVAVSTDQFRVGAEGGDAEAAELAAARAQQQAEASERQIREIVAELALVAGVSREEVTVDRDKKRAIVKATPIEGATLGAYRTLERRVARSAEGWDIRLIPPARPLPAIPLDKEGNPDGIAIALIAWAQQRIDAPIMLSGPPEATSKVRGALAAAGTRASRMEEAPGDTVTARWLAPGSAN
ncbi:TIGR00341 family protein [Sphingomicrobium nitratireducens]|uniref:TIGR00341 family protein n=1 Tax=Sphingomicrobium nitratireducens TaxID=2964666 RepID=UPI00223EF200|nr:TIGR00341 family protein [Sphingomicrobium nitratireducens]